jgi:hypothetical protein
MQQAPPAPPVPTAPHAHAPSATPVDPKIAAAAAADAAAKAEAARKAALVASTAPPPPLTAVDIMGRIREQLAFMKNPNNTSDMTYKGCDRIEALLELLDPLLPVVKA